MIPHACSLGAVGRFVMFGIMAGMDLKNTFVVFATGAAHGRGCRARCVQ